MSKKKLIDRIAERFDGNREVAQHALDAVVEGITKSLAAGEKVAVRGLGVFDRGSEGSKRRIVPTFAPTDELKDVVAGVRKVRSRVVQSLSMVPSQAASAAESASRVASSAARRAADTVRGERGDDGASTATPSADEKASGSTSSASAKKVAAKKV
ncbi:HU family DNA-binding protein, partial [Haloactinopolyspora sp.]|uniref:HU family DNA-binding protein n=1 Tax=Haloactinopolyspora sp. TaxID=1966353 RepID=UPI00260F2F9A